MARRYCFVRKGQRQVDENAHWRFAVERTRFYPAKWREPMADKQSKEARAPLSGKRIVVPGSELRARELSEQLRALGADVIELPTIRIEPPSDLRAFAELVQDAHGYDWIVFTDTDSVTAFFDLFYKLYDDAREIGAARIAAIGPATAKRIKEFHLHVDLSAEELASQSIVREFRKDGSVENLRILLVRAEKARDLLPKELSALGAIVDEGFAYRTVPETRDDDAARRRLLEEGADLITFTSSSMVESFLALGLPWPAGMRVATLGPATSKAAREHGLNVAIETRRDDIPGLVEAVRKFFLGKTDG
jgi:uroporphyrinogen III methyltransferase/synthase